MDKQAVCTWLDPEGALHCTYIGIPALRILLTGADKCLGACIHIKGVRAYINAISNALGNGNLVAQKSLAELFATIYSTSIEQYRQHCPTQENYFYKKHQFTQRLFPLQSVRRLFLLQFVYSKMIQKLVLFVILRLIHLACMSEP